MFLKFFLQNAFLQIFQSNVRRVLVYEIPECGETSMVLSPLCKGVYIAMSAIIEMLAVKDKREIMHTVFMNLSQL